MNRSLVNKGESPFLGLARKFFDNDFEYFPSLLTKSSGLSNVLEKENEYLIELSAPGLKKEDINIELEKDVLKISSNFEDSKEETNDGYYRREFYKSSFERSFSVPKGVNKDDISATMDNGILIISIPKLKEEIKNENIKITIK
jgi:HSP20 family protein